MLGSWTPTTPTCRDSGNTPATIYDYTSLTPCPEAATGISISVDTTRMSDGDHNVALVLRDGAGRTKVVTSQKVTFANHDAPATPSGSGPAGKLTVPKALRAVARGEKRTIAGRLLDTAGKPLPGATIVAVQRLAMNGAPWTPLATLTTGPDGQFSTPVPTSASRDVRFDYPRSGGTDSATTTVPVRAAMTLNTATPHLRRFGTLRLSGQLRVDALTKRGAYIDVQLQQGKSWRTIASQRTDAAGHWSWRYRLSSGRAATCVFRARLRPSGDIASTPTSSRPVRVRVN